MSISHNIGEVTLNIAHEAFIRASDSAQALLVRADAAEAAEAIVCAKHAELANKYGALVARTQFAATYRKRFYIE